MRLATRWNSNLASLVISKSASSPSFHPRWWWWLTRLELVNERVREKQESKSRHHVIAGGDSNVRWKNCEENISVFPKKRLETDGSSRKTNKSRRMTTTMMMSGKMSNVRNNNNNKPRLTIFVHFFRWCLSVCLSGDLLPNVRMWRRWWRDKIYFYF